MFLKSHGGVIQIMWELKINLWGMREKVKTVGEFEKS